MFLLSPLGYVCEEEADITSFVVGGACPVLVVKTNFLVRRVHISLIPRPEARCTCTVCASVNSLILTDLLWS